MKHLIQPPVVIDESGATDIFETAEAAEIYMEPEDVEAQRYKAFDSAGRLLRILPTTPQVTIEPAELVPTHSEQLRTLLAKFLRDCGSPDLDLSSLTLQELVQRSLKFKS